MKKSCSFVCWFGIMFFVFAASAGAVKLKIGIIDTQSVIKNSKVAQDVRKGFMINLEAKRAVLRAKQEGIRAAEQELRVQGSSISSTELKEKRENLAQEVKELRRLRTDIEEELKKKDVELTRQLLKEVKQVVDKLAKEKKYTLILEKRSVVFSDAAVDITNEIIKRFDKEKGKK